MREDWQNAGFGVYIHWPFCQAKCPYCDFNSHVREVISESDWVKAMATEIEATANLTGPRHVDTVFFGGGTPSLMSPETVSSILEAIKANWTLRPDAEVSLEANPTSVEAHRFEGYKQAGVNRVSLGVQSLDDGHLKALGRRHTAFEARQAFDIARKNFDRVNFDLIYARQHQTLNDWRIELDRALELAVDHLSLYQLTIEPQTAFGRLAKAGKLLGLPKDSVASDMYSITQDVCGAAGMPAYEVSNHARADAQSEHNLIYWRYGDYAGIGPGAHGRLTIAGTKIATTSPSSPEDWLKKALASGQAFEQEEVISIEDQLLEYVMMSLRLAEGCDMERVHAFSNGGLNEGRIKDLMDQGFLKRTNKSLIATAKGRIVLNSLLAEMLSDR